MTSQRSAYAGHNITGRDGLIAIDKVGNAISFYDPVSLKQIKRIASAEPTVHELAITPDHARAFVPLYGDGIYGANKNPNNKILVVDLKAQAIAGQIELGAFVAPHGMVYASSGKLWLVCDIPGKLLCVDPDRGSIVSVAECPSKGPHVLTLLPDETRICVSAKEGPPVVFEVAADGGLAAGKPMLLELPGGLSGGTDGIASSPDGSRLLVIDNSVCDLHVFDPGSGRALDRVPLTMMPYTNPKRSRLSKLMFSPDGRHLIATAYATGLAWLIDAGDLRKQTVLAVAKGPMGIAYAPDGKTALITSHDSGLITVVDLESRRAVAAHDGGSGIEVLAYY